MRTTIHAGVVLGFIVICCGAQAQKDFREGYVVTNDDTIHGLLEYRTTSNVKKSCLFKTDRKSRTVEYSVSEVQAFGFANRQFERIEVDGEYVFGRIFSKGSLSLYRVDTIFYLKSRNVSNVVRLPPPFNQVVDVQNESGSKTRFVKTERPYVLTLNSFIAGCGLSASRAGYSPKDLSRLVNAFNECRSDIVRLDEGPWVTFRPYLLAGYVQSTLKLDSVPASTFAATSFTTGGLGFEISTPRKFDRLNFRFEAQYFHSTYHGINDTETASGNLTYTRHDKISYDATYIKFPIGVRYKFRASNTFYLAGGGYVSVLTKNVDSKAERERTTYISGDYFETTRETVTGINSFRAPRGFYLAVGYEASLFKKLSVFAEVRGDNGAGFVGRRIQPQSKLTNVAAMVGLKF